MNLVLKDFQTEAVESLHQQVADARKRAARGKLEAITLSAPTGSGKTVILTRLIELIFEGDEDHHADPDAIDRRQLNLRHGDNYFSGSTTTITPARRQLEGTIDNRALR